jgi:putative peptidoglycan lipid II flippase
MTGRVIRLLVVTGLGVGGSLVNFLVQAVIAYRFGAGLNVDAYLFSLSLPAFAAGLIGICISYVAVPELARVADKPALERERSAGFLAVVGIMAAALILAGIPAMLLQPQLLLPPGSAIRAHPELRLLIGIAWATGGAQIINALLASRLNAMRRPIAASMLVLPPGLIAAAILVVLPPDGIWLAAVGLIVGTVAATGLGFLLQRNAFAWPSLRLLREQAELPLYRSAWLSVLALTCFSSYVLIDSFWAPRVGEGALASLGYAQRILIGAGNLIAVGPSAIAVPMMARMVAAHDAAGFRRAMILLVGGVAAGAGCIAVVIASFSEGIVALLFKRGAFGEEAVGEVAAALFLLAPGMVGMLAGAMLMRALFCIPGSFAWAAMIGITWSLLYFLLSGLLIGRGVGGLATAYSLSWGIVAVAASFIVWHRAGKLQEGSAR